jgi:hypothetical protein
MARRSGPGHHPRGKKRPKHWHVSDIARRWARTHLPEVGSGADPTAGEPTPLRGKARTDRGDAA